MTAAVLPACGLRYGAGMTQRSNNGYLTETSFRRLAGDRLLAAPSDAIFDPRTGRSWGASDFDLNPELVADRRHVDAGAELLTSDGPVPIEAL